MSLLELAFASAAPALSPRRFAVREGLSTLFEVTVTAFAPDLDLASLAGREARLTLADDRAVRLWSGLCRSARLTSVETSGLCSYEIVLVPLLWKLTQRRNHRLFQRGTVADFVDRLLAGWAFPSPPVWALDRAAYPVLDQRVQYGESDYAFLCRLLEEAGIAFYFAADESGHSRLCFHDQPHHNDQGWRLPFAAAGERARSARAEHVTAVELGHAVRPSRLTLRDHDLRRPAYPLFAQANVDDPAEPAYEQYLYQPGAFSVVGGVPDNTPVADDAGPVRADEKVGKRLANRSLRSLRVSRRQVTFRTNALRLVAGVVFGLDGHPRPDLAPDKTLLVTELSIEGAVDEDWSIVGHAVFTDHAFRPPKLTPRPRIDGVQSATVMGGPGEEIHTDELGRVRVRMPWDREGKASCWARVSQGWAGAGHGFFLLPRVGHEVLVGFVEGDPDQPVIVGRVHNAANPTPWPLPAHRTVSTWKSCSSPGLSGYNELRFEDAAGREYVSVRAERTMTQEVGRDRLDVVGQDLSRVVRRDEALSIGRDRAKVILSDERESTAGERAVTVRRHRHATVGGRETTLAGTSYSVAFVPDLAAQLDAGAAAVAAPPGATSITLVDRRITLATDLGAIVLDGPDVILSGDMIELGLPGDLAHELVRYEKPKPPPFTMILGKEGFSGTGDVEQDERAWKEAGAPRLLATESATIESKTKDELRVTTLEGELNQSVQERLLEKGDLDHLYAFKAQHDTHDEKRKAIVLGDVTTPDGYVMLDGGNNVDPEQSGKPLCDIYLKDPLLQPDPGQRFVDFGPITGFPPRLTSVNGRALLPPDWDPGGPFWLMGKSSDGHWQRLVRFDREGNVLAEVPFTRVMNIHGGNDQGLHVRDPIHRDGVFGTFLKYGVPLINAGLMLTGAGALASTIFNGLVSAAQGDWVGVGFAFLNAVTDGASRATKDMLDLVEKGYNLSVSKDKLLGGLGLVSALVGMNGQNRATTAILNATSSLISYARTGSFANAVGLMTSLYAVYRVYEAKLGAEAAERKLDEIRVHGEDPAYWQQVAAEYQALLDAPVALGDATSPDLDRIILNKSVTILDTSFDAAGQSIGLPADIVPIAPAANGEVLVADATVDRFNNRMTAEEARAAQEADFRTLQRLTAVVLEQARRARAIHTWGTEWGNPLGWHHNDMEAKKLAETGEIGLLDNNNIDAYFPIDGDPNNFFASVSDPETGQTTRPFECYEMAYILAQYVRANANQFNGRVTLRIRGRTNDLGDKNHTWVEVTIENGLREDDQPYYRSVVNGDIYFPLFDGRVPTLTTNDMFIPGVTEVEHIPIVRNSAFDRLIIHEPVNLYKRRLLDPTRT